jgi:hypothetical protein
MDQHFHTHDKSNTAEIYKKFVKEYMHYELEADGLNMNASFEHLGNIFICLIWLN